MAVRPRQEDGFGLIELLAAMAVLSIALLALLAGYGSAVSSLRATSLSSTASGLADGQMELYRALPYASIGLDAATTTAIGDSSSGSYDSLYATNPLLDGAFVTDPVTGVVSQLPSGTVNDFTIADCGATPQCLPVQTVTGNDGNPYRIETFIVDEPTASIGWYERVVTVVVRDANVSGMPVLAQLSSGFDRGQIAA